jgi:hypothetical protein
MNQELENLINLSLIKGSISEKEKEIIFKKAEKLGEDKDEIEMIIENKIHSINVKINDTTNINSFGVKIPLIVAWLINLFAWIIFISTRIELLELLAGFTCLFAGYISYKHSQIDTKPLFGFITAGYLIYISIADAVWIIYWAIKNI